MKDVPCQEFVWFQLIAWSIQTQQKWRADVQAKEVLRSTFLAAEEAIEQKKAQVQIAMFWCWRLHATALDPSLQSCTWHGGKPSCLPNTKTNTTQPPDTVCAVDARGSSAQVQVRLAEAEAERERQHLELQLASSDAFQSQRHDTPWHIDLVPAQDTSNFRTRSDNSDIARWHVQWINKDVLVRMCLMLKRQNRREKGSLHASDQGGGVSSGSKKPFQRTLESDFWSFFEAARLFCDSKKWGGFWHVRHVCYDGTDSRSAGQCRNWRPAWRPHWSVQLSVEKFLELRNFQLKYA